MLVGYVSDERYVALADVAIEFVQLTRSVEAHSRATGAVYADLTDGEWEVVLTKNGYGGKRLRLMLPQPQPYQFRLLSDGLLGYAWPKCVRSGEQSEFRVHTSEPYKLELWRYGWRKEHAKNLGWYDEHGPRANVQITPDGDYTQTGVRWNEVGFHSAHLRQLVTSPAQTGLYYFHAKTSSGAFFSFPWVVAPAKPQTPVAVLASDINWNAYNNFGGRSNYIHAEAFPPRPTVNARQELLRYTDPRHMTWGAEGYAPLSFDRPEPINHVPEHEQACDPVEGRAACHVAPTEWRLLAWLEREGFAYDLYSETQLHAGVLDLDQYRVLMLGPHPEYWTKIMYQRVKNWVFQRGGRLVYLGGNGLNCEVEIIDDRTMVVHNGDARDLWSGTYPAESRFGRRNESEANLLGVVFTDSGIMTAAPYKVVDASHWAFAKTGLGEGELFGEKCQHRRVPGGASGHETDKISPSSPKQVRLLAKGTNPDGGGAEMVQFDVPGGGSVFSVGSICYPNSLLVDERVSRITSNVLDRFLAD